MDDVLLVLAARQPKARGRTDGIAADADGTASLTAFPFLDRPN